ncbi:MTAP family purine nucleoside phosphorylase [Microcella sp.]|uniref:MTAP family purine nucleoside phosphorylase n=1 Tax=Microcella sp. TaxID=1913979 RepID=UPI00391D62E7
MRILDRVPVGIFGGSGVYDLLDDARTITIDTPYGPTSSSIAIGRLGDSEVAFISRHGEGHHLSPNRVPYRANIWALASLGVRAIIASSAVGGLSAETPTGSFVVPDQLLDRTRDRDDTYFDGADAQFGVQHLGFADPYCSALRAAMIAALTDAGEQFRPTGTTVVIAGPRFSTRAESAAWRAAGAHIVNMTQYPEAALAAELNIGYASLSFVTDADTGRAPGDEPVSAETVLRLLAKAKPRIAAAIDGTIARIPADYVPDQHIDPAVVSLVLAREAKA